MNECWCDRLADGISGMASCKFCVDKLKLQIHDLQGIVHLCIEQGGLNFHVEGGKCPEDDTCDCPDALRVNAAMKGYTPEVRWAKKCEDDKHDWRDARNEIVTSGEFCIKCGALRAGNAATIEKRPDEIIRKEAEALLDPKSPGWNEGADLLLKELKDRKSAKNPNREGAVTDGSPGEGVQASHRGGDQRTHGPSQPVAPSCEHDREWVEFAGTLVQKIHDLQHTGSSPLCRQPTCKAFYERTTTEKRTHDHARGVCDEATCLECKKAQIEEKRKTEHCYGTHCHYLTERRCMCLCRPCGEAKKKDR
jgi:hypothetical protein